MANSAGMGSRSGLFGNPIRRRSRVGTVAALLLLLAAPAARAEPILIPTAGGISTGGFGFIGTSFSIGGGHVTLQPAVTCAPCVPGTSVNLSATATMFPGPLGFAHIDGIVSTQPVDFIGSFALDAGSVLVPHVAAGGATGASSPFTFTGTLAGFADADAGTPLFSVSVRGSGTARVQFLNSGGGVTMGDLSFEIQDPAATPEPGTLLLIGSAGALLAVRRRVAVRGPDDLFSV